MDQVDQSVHESSTALPLDTPKLNKALAAAQAEFEPIKKTRTANVEMKNGGKYKFKYADLSDVIAATAKALSKHGLSTLNRVEEDAKGMKLVLYLRHESGETISTFLPIKMFDRAQELGSLLSFYRRYLLSALIGVASEEDDDANLAEGNSANITDRDGKKTVETTPPPKKPEPTAQELLDRAPNANAALRKDRERASQPPPPQDHFDRFPPEDDGVTLLDQLVQAAESKAIPHDEMREIIKKCTGFQKRAKDLSTPELELVLNYVNKLYRKPE